MSFKRYRIIFILIFMFANGSFGFDDDQTTNIHPHKDETSHSDNKEGRALYPRMEYNEWLPVGRGDPLKDPTYDYMPPVLERVRYWAEGTSHKDKNDILILGVPSKKLSGIKQNDKYSYGPVRRNYYSQQYQAPHQSQSQTYQHNYQQQEQQQYLPTKLMPPPMHSSIHSSDSYPLASQQPQQNWNTQNEIYTDSRAESSVNYVSLSRPTPTTKNPMPFLPTISPDFYQESEAIYTTTQSPTRPIHPTILKHDNPMSMNIQMMSNGFNVNSPATDYKKPFLQTILQTETAAPFTKIPSTAYQIEYTSNFFNPQVINSMATTSYPSFSPTEPTTRSSSIRTTTMKQTTMTEPKSTTTSSTTTATKGTEAPEMSFHNPEMQAGWPVYHLIIEGHSKVKTYGLNDASVERNLPKIRPVQPRGDPVVRHVTNNDESPEYHPKHLHSPKKDPNKYFQKQDQNKKSAMSNLLSLLDGSFGKYLENDSNNLHESEVKNVKNKKENSENNKRKTRSIPSNWTNSNLHQHIDKDQ